MDDVRHASLSAIANRHGIGMFLYLNSLLAAHPKQKDPFYCVNWVVREYGVPYKFENKIWRSGTIYDYDPVLKNIWVRIKGTFILTREEDGGIQLMWEI